jgi:hypothetical protein
MKTIRTRSIIHTAAAFLPAIAATLALAAGVAAQAKPNFSGEWTLVADKSDFGPMPAPTKLVRTIVHTEPTLKIKTVQTSMEGESSSETTFSTDGKPTNNTVMGNAMSSVAKWEDTTLVLNNTMTVEGTAITIEDRLSLSGAGKTLTMARKVNTPDGPIDIKIVMAKKQ